MCGGGLLLAARQAGRTRDAVRHENTAGKGEQHGEREERREAAHRGPQTEGSEFVRASEHGGGRVGSMCAAVRVHARRIANRERTESERRAVARSCGLGVQGPFSQERTTVRGPLRSMLRALDCGSVDMEDVRGEFSEAPGISEGLPALPATVTELRCGSPKRPKLVGTAQYYVAVQLRQHAIRSGRPDALRPDAGPLRRR
jgi:hypothetical protein